MNPRLMATIFFVLSFLLSGLLVLDGSGAGAPLQPESFVRQQRPTFSTRLDLVILHVLVRDNNGSYVPDLSSSAFTVREDGQSQRIQLFDKQDAPVTAGLLLDSSGSMMRARDRLITAATMFATISNPDDELFALAFNEAVQPVLPKDNPFTSNTGTLRSAMYQNIVTVGRTALYDAIVAGLQYVSNGKHERQVLVVVSDGGDNASKATFDEVQKRVRASNAVIYTVAIEDPIDPDAPRRLKTIAGVSGAGAFVAKDVEHVEDALRQISQDIRNSYTLGYVSTNTNRSGRLRRIQVVAKSPEGRKLDVRTRQGYIAEAK